MKRDEEVNSDDDGDDDMMVLTLPRLPAAGFSYTILSVWYATLVVCCCVLAFRMMCTLCIVTVVVPFLYLPTYTYIV